MVCTNEGWVYWCIYASLCHHELNSQQLKCIEIKSTALLVYCAVKPQVTWLHHTVGQYCRQNPHGTSSSSSLSATYMHKTGSGLVQIMVCHQFSTKPLAEPMLTLSTGPLGTNFSEIWIEIQRVSFKKMHSKLSSAKCRPFCPGGDELNCEGPLFPATMAYQVPPS